MTVYIMLVICGVLNSLFFLIVGGLIAYMSAVLSTAKTQNVSIDTAIDMLAELTGAYNE